MSEPLSTAFKDTKGRTWSLNLTVGRAMFLRDKLGFDVDKLTESDGPLTELVANSWRLVEILVHMTAQDRQTLGVSEADFLDSLEGETLDDATRAFLNGVTLSLKKLKRRSLAAMVEQIEKGTELVATRMETKIREAGEKMAGNINSAIGD